MYAVVTRSKALGVEELPDPIPGPGQALVRTLSCGICGSDLHMLQHADRMRDMYARSGVSFSMDLDAGVVFGHEFSAEILDYGPDTDRPFPTGTRVCATPIAYGRHGPETVGYSNNFPGGYGQQMVLMKDLLLPIPNGLSSELAALTEPMAVGAHAVVRAGLEKDHVCVIVGCGPVGLAVLLALKARGHGPIIVSDFAPARRAMAERLGADIVLDPAEVSPFSKWSDFSVPASITEMIGMQMAGSAIRPAAIFECVGVPGVLQQIIEGAPRDARIVVVGVCMETDHLEPMMAITKEIDMRFVLGYSGEEFAETLHQIAEGAIDVTPMVTGKVGLSGVADAFEALSNPDGHVKILVDPTNVT